MISLRDVEIQLVLTPEDRRRWDALVPEHHYLPYSGLFGKSLRHVAVHDGEWLALVGWAAGAFKVGVRDRWIGWSRAQQFSRLHLIANNIRYVLLGDDRPANLASRVLGLSLRRLSRDMEALHGYPVYLAESFVDPSRFSGTCYRASNWQSLGFTRGFSREPGGSARWRHNGQKKEVFVFDLTRDAQRLLCDDEVPGSCRVDGAVELPDDGTLRSLHDIFARMKDFRKARGRRHSLACYFTIMAAARLCGFRGVSAFGEFAAMLSQDQLEAVGAFWSPTRKCHVAPATSTFHYILSLMPPDTLDNALREWIETRRDGARPVAIDGKNVCGASKQIENEQRIMVAAVEHGSGLVLGQLQVPDKTNEIPAVRRLVGELDLKGRTVTMDAMHVQQETAQCIQEAGANYVMTAVKKNQKALQEDIAAIDWSKARHFEGEWEKGHGRLEKRDCAAIDITDEEWNGFCDLHGRQQAFRIIRNRETIKTRKASTQIVYGLTSLSAEEAGPEEIGQIVRTHWTIENRVHYVRDFSYDEDRCRVRVKNLPRNLAALSNIAISIIRIHQPRGFVPTANRSYAFNPQDALDAIMT